MFSFFSYFISHTQLQFHQNGIRTQYFVEKKPENYLKWAEGSFYVARYVNNHLITPAGANCPKKEHAIAPMEITEVIPYNNVKSFTNLRVNLYEKNSFRPR